MVINSPYQHNPDDSTSISHNYIRSIIDDRNGVLWIATVGEGLLKFDREKKVFNKFNRKILISKKISLITFLQFMKIKCRHKNLKSFHSIEGGETSAIIGERVLAHGFNIN